MKLAGILVVGGLLSGAVAILWPASVPWSGIAIGLTCALIGAYYIGKEKAE